MADRPKMPAPEGCVYGPWWDESSKLWVCFNDESEPAYWCGESWRFDQVLESPLCNELLRLANELGQKEARIRELEAREPDEEGQAVLWLLRRGWQIEYFDGGFGVWHDHLDCSHFREISPAEEAKKLGWGAEND